MTFEQTVNWRRSRNIECVHTDGAERQTSEVARFLLEISKKQEKKVGGSWGGAAVVELGLWCSSVYTTNLSISNRRQQANRAWGGHVSCGGGLQV